MLAKAWNDFSTPTRKHSCRSSSYASACLGCVSANKHSVLSSRRSLTRPTIGPPSCDWRRLSQRSSPACAVRRRRLMSRSASESYGSWSKMSWWGTTPSPFVTASQFHRAPHKTGVRRQVGQMAKVTFCVRGVVSPLLANVYLHYVFDLWVEVWRKKVASGEVIVVRYADDLVVGFQYRTDAERFLQEFRERLAKFGLELHADKTRLIEFGRFAARDRKYRGEGKPETFTFLGFTHFCGQLNSRRAFIVWRITAKKRMVAKLKAIKAELQRRKHHRTTEVGAWLRKVVLGYYQYHAVPGNSTQLRIFNRRVGRLWRSVLVRRSQRAQMRWDRLTPLLNRWIPQPRILHPYPDARFAATHPR